MLVLSRKVDESIRLGNDIVVRVLAIRGDKVRLGFEAPNHVAIVRSELDLREEDEPTAVED